MHPENVLAVFAEGLSWFVLERTKAMLAEIKHQEADDDHLSYKLTYRIGVREYHTR